MAMIVTIMVSWTILTVAMIIKMMMKTTNNNHS